MTCSAHGLEFVQKYIFSTYLYACMCVYIRIHVNIYTYIYTHRHTRHDTHTHTHTTSTPMLYVACLGFIQPRRHLPCIGRCQAAWQISEVSAVECQPFSTLGIRLGIDCTSRWQLAAWKPRYLYGSFC